MFLIPCYSAEKYHVSRGHTSFYQRNLTSIDESVAMASMYVANNMNIKAIISLTETGKTPLWMSRIRTGIPIYALSRNITTRKKLNLYRDVFSFNFDVTKCKHSEVNFAAVEFLTNMNFLQEGDVVILTKGDYMGIEQGTNAMKILEVGNIRR